MVEKQSKLLNLKELSDPIGKVDRTLIAVIAERMRLSRQVEAYKRQEGEPIVRYEAEDNRLAVIEEIAKEFGINPHFARGLLYFIIDESCKVQLIQLQEKGGIPDNLYEGDDEGWYRHLKQNLLELTALFAPIYDEHYGGEKTPFAVAMYRDYEKAVLQELMQDLPDNELCVDVGCATGSMSFFLANSFRRVVGYDLSPEMIEEAQRKLTQEKSSLSFSVADIETGIPIDDASASLVVLNMGTASEFRDSEFMMREVERILRPGGHVLLSFYNADALLYRLGFLPWPVGINAAVNLRRKSLEQHGGYII